MDPTMPTTPVVSKHSLETDTDIKFRKLARELSTDIRPLEQVLDSHEITFEEWSLINGHPLFQKYLRQFIEEWESAVNTAERVRLKSLVFVEEAMPEFFARAHDRSETLSSKVELLKAVARFAGIGMAAEGMGIGERMSVTINIGEGRQVRVERDITPAIEEDKL